MAGKSYSEKETLCTYNFNRLVEQYGGVWHVFTPGMEMEMFNVSETDYKFSVTNLALSAYETDTKVITDAHMENHLHVLVAGPRHKCFDILDAYSYRLAKHLGDTGRYVPLAGFRCDNPTQVETIESIRTEIAYINRNGFVNDPRFLVSSYPWGAGCFYFCNSLMKIGGERFNDLPFRVKRDLVFRRVFEVPDSYLFKDGMILPYTYADVGLGESMFHDAHHYCHYVTRNFEAYSLEAAHLGDTAVLTREELFSATKMITMRDYNVKQPSLLSMLEKTEVARKMHSDYNASNAQIRSILKMTEDQVNLLFPLKNRNKF